ncbi:MAG TPA: DUF1080 domain-containing protein [Gemmatimonadaceae bacterium]|nr:DUF1080 domain-containing protein [Gemmatimonadaceae bacterium]
MKICITSLAALMLVSASASAQNGAWRVLFDGKTFAGWRGLGYDSVPSAHWVIENGTIKKVPRGQVKRMPDGQPASGGDLITTDTFRDFELVWEWKIGRGGNSGVKYNVSESLSVAASPNHAALGWEYQLLDDSLAEDNKIPSHRAGSLYDMIAPSVSTVKPAGEWNESRLVFNGNRGEHWLNGKKIVEFDMSTAQFDSLFAQSKYKNIQNFRARRAGHIVLQDHGEEVYFRNIRIRVLN